MDLGGALALLLNIALCLCYQTDHLFHLDTTFRDKMCPATDVEFQTSARSAIDCVQSCTKVAACRSLIFYRTNRTCYGLTMERPCAVFTDLPGAVFYKPAMTMGPAGGPTTAATAIPATGFELPSGCNDPMVVGVPNSHMTASSYCCYGYEAWNGRLDNQWAWTGWSRPNEYLQVDFWTERNITAIVTQGEWYYYEWVAAYKILVSADCATFVTLPTMFIGNTNRWTKVTNHIDPPVSGRCVRIVPVTWYSRPSIRLEVLGCVP